MIVLLLIMYLKGNEMKKVLIALCLVSMAGIGHADQLSDGTRLWEKHDYQHAAEIFTTLANAGNADAQLQLGEMFGFGEGMPEDMGKAEFWLKKAAAGGNKDAPASLETMKLRATHKADIAYYTTQYDGADLGLAKLGCVKPVIPAVSRTAPQIRKVSDDLAQWRQCYNQFVVNLNDALPVGKKIPADTAKIMSATEFQGAVARMDQAYAALASGAKKLAGEVSESTAIWENSTELTVKENAAKTAQLREQQRKDMQNINGNSVMMEERHRTSTNSPK